MVSVKDFKPGQTAYILTRKRGRTQEHFVSQCVVVSVGRKYVKTAKQESSSITSDFYNVRGDDNENTSAIEKLLSALSDGECKGIKGATAYKITQFATEKGLI